MAERSLAVNRTLATSRSTASNRVAVRDMGTALRFDGGTAKIDCGAGSASLSLGSGNTVSLWFKTNAKTGDMELFSKGIGVAFPFSVRFGSSLDFSYRSYDGVSSSIISTSVRKYNDGEWHHFVGVLEKGVAVRGYIDGVTYGSNPDITGVIADNGLNIGIGYRTGSTKYFLGLIDEPRIWSRALTANEIQNLYLHNSVPQDGLVAEYLFDEATGTTAIDSSGNGNDGTITGATYTTDTPLRPRTSV